MTDLKHKLIPASDLLNLSLGDQDNRMNTLAFSRNMLSLGSPNSANPKALNFDQLSTSMAFS